MAPRAYSLIGTVYMALLDSNKAKVGGYKKVGNCYPFALQVQTEQKKQLSRMKESAGQTLHAKTTISDITGSLVLREWIAATLAWALSGQEVALSGSGGTVTDEAVTAVSDEYVQLANKAVSSVVVQDVTDTTTYAEGTDYEIVAALGLIKALSTGSISDSDVLHIDYSYAAESGYKVNIGSDALIRVAILIDGENEEDETPITMEFDSVVLSSNGEINLISDPDTDYEQIPFNCAFETLSGQTSPGRINGVPL